MVLSRRTYNTMWPALQNTPLLGPGVFLEVSGLLFMTYVVLARRARSHVALRDQAPSLAAAAAPSESAGPTEPASPADRDARPAVARPRSTAPRVAATGDLPRPTEAARPGPIADPALTPSPDGPPAPEPPEALTRVTVDSLRLLVQREGRGAVPALSEALGSPSAEVAQAAANLLGQVGGPEALAALLQADQGVRPVKELPGSRSAWGTPELDTEAPSPAPRESLRPAGGAAGRVRRFFQTPFQRPVEPPPSPEEETVPPALRLFEPLARQDFRALHRYSPHDPRELDEKDLAQALIQLVENPEEKPALRYFATKNLVRFRHPDIRECLLDQLKAPLPLIRYAAADALAVHGDSEAVPHLVEALGDPEGSVRASAAHTLAVLGGDQAIRPLLGLREDADEVVRYAARRALDAIGKRKKISSLLRRA